MSESGKNRQPDVEKSSLEKKTDHRREMFAAFLLGMAALAGSWASYQSALWDGEQAAHYSRANAVRAEAVRVWTLTGQVMGLDLAMFMNWLNAKGTGNEALEKFYREHFRDEFIPAFDAWVAAQSPDSNNAVTPLLRPEYKLAVKDQAMELEKEADKLFGEGQRANSIGDKYVLSTVVFSSVLFFAGIAPQFERVRMRKMLLAIAAALCLLGLFRLITYPIH